MRFLREVSGSVALPIAFMLPVLLVATGAAVDYSNIVNERMRLQNVLDEAVIRSLRRPVMTDDERKDVVENTVENSDSCDATVVAMADDVSASAVAECSVSTYFMHLLSYDLVRIEVTSAAVVATSPGDGYGSANSCVYLANPTGTGLLMNGAGVLGTDCEIMVASDDNEAAVINSGSEIRGTRLCIAGQTLNNGADVQPEIETGCAVAEVPELVVQEPDTSICDSYGAGLSGNAVLSPGTYCGDVNLNSNAALTLEPGTYSFRTGSLNANDGTTLMGTDVTLYFGPDAGSLHANSSSNIALTSPSTGDYAGHLIIQNKGNLSSMTIDSDRIDRLQGMIHAPGAQIILNANSAINPDAETLSIVAGSLSLNAHINLTQEGGEGGGSVTPPDATSLRSIRITR